MTGLLPLPAPGEPLCERWRAAPGASRYLVSNLGRVRSLVDPAHPRELRSAPNDKGYLKVDLWTDDGRRRQVYVQRLVLLAFYGPPPTEDHDADHINFQRRCNALSNLRWLLSDENRWRWAPRVEDGW